jgi:prepilin signal peptidase PulO-like enzyme (type II secretory pathway)
MFSLTQLPSHQEHWFITVLVTVLVAVIVSQILFKFTYLLPRLLFKPQQLQWRILLRPLKHVFQVNTPWYRKNNLICSAFFWQAYPLPLKPNRIKQWRRIGWLSLLIPLLSLVMITEMLSAIIITLLGWWLLLSSEIDQEHQLLLDSLTLPLLWLGLILNLTLEWVSLEQAVLGAITGYLLLWSVYQVHFLLTKREGMGYGDFKLTAALGAWAGLQNLPLILILAAITALGISLWRRWRFADPMDQMFPFGPSLAIAGWLVLTLVAINQ